MVDIAEFIIGPAQEGPANPARSHALRGDIVTPISLTWVNSIGCSP
jgi:hypothetical protein